MCFRDIVVSLLVLFVLRPDLNAAIRVEPMTAGATVSGMVHDAATGETIVNATLRIQGTKLGAYTNKSGFYSIRGVPEGNVIVIVSCIGYERMELPVTLTMNESLKMDIRLTRTMIQAGEVSVTASKLDEDRRISISQVNVPVTQVSQMRIGGEADLFRAIQMLPGVLTSSQISSGLFIRGGSPDQNLILLDGMTVYNPTHLFGFISAFNTDAVKDIELMKGGFPAEFTGRMSAVLNVTQKDGNRQSHEGNLSVGLISTRASIQGPIGKGSYFLGGRRTYFELISALLPQDEDSPIPEFNFYDVNARVMQELGPNDRLTLSGFLTSDALDWNAVSTSFDIGIGNRASALKWTHVYGDNLFSSVTLSASRYRNGFGGNNAGFEFAVNNSIVDYTGKAEFEWFPINGMTVKTGYEGTYYTFVYGQNLSGDRSNSDTASTFNLEEHDHIHAVYAQTNLRVLDRLSVQAGVRANYWDFSGIASLDPRLAARYEIDDRMSVKVAWGIFHQYLRLASAPDFSFFDTWLPTDSTVPAGKAHHYIVSVENQINEDMTFSVEAYYKSLNNINELNNTQTQARSVSDIFFIGSGEAYGVELFLQRRYGRLSGWVGYAIGWVEGTFANINDGNPFRPKYDRRHDLKITAMYDISERFDVAATFVFQSGQSYTGATSWGQARIPGATIGSGLIQPSQRWGLRLPPSHQLNLSATYHTTLFGLPFRINADIYNVYSRADIWFRYFDLTKPVPEVKDSRLLPVIPTVGFEIKF